MKLQSLGPSDFDRLAATTRLQPQQVEFARCVLVGGDTISAVAKRAGIAKQQVSRAVERVRTAYLELESVESAEPKNTFVVVELELPAATVAALNGIAPELRRGSAARRRRAVDLATRTLAALVQQLRELQ